VGNDRGNEIILYNMEMETLRKIYGPIKDQNAWRI